MFGACTAPVQTLLARLIASGTAEPALNGSTERGIDEHPGHSDADESAEPPWTEQWPGREGDD
jgi:hypothetical protein